MKASPSGVVLAACAMALGVPVSGTASTQPTTAQSLVRVWTISYRAHDGLPRRALVVLPRWYGPNDDPPIPLIISPHGRGVSVRSNVRRWANLPARGGFAVVNPEGQGRRLTLFSWGDPGEIADLARMPTIVRHALPWLRIDHRRIYAYGGSMGGQETLLLLARFPRLLAGAAAFDAPVNMAARYHAFAGQPYGHTLQQLAQVEVGGTPAGDPRAYAVRSPLAWARKIAFAGVPLQIWWSTRDRVVVDQRRESGLLYRAIKLLNPAAPVKQFVGNWAHTSEMKARGYLPFALSQFGLLSGHYGGPPAPTRPEQQQQQQPVI